MSMTKIIKVYHNNSTRAILVSSCCFEKKAYKTYTNTWKKEPICSSCWYTFNWVQNYITSIESE